MTEIVDHRYARCAGPHDIEPPRKPRKGMQRSNGVSHRYPGGNRRADGGQRIGQIVPARHLQDERIFLSIVAVDDRCGKPGRPLGNRSGHHADLCPLLLDAKGQRLPRARQQGQRLGVIGIDDGDIAGRQKVPEQAAQFDHRLVVQRHVQ